MKKIITLSILLFILSFSVKPLVSKAAGFGDVTSKFKSFGSGVGAQTYSTPESLISILIGIALTMVGLIFFVLMIYAGYLWFTARGEDEPIQKAQKIIKSTIIGFVVIASAYAITLFVGKRLELGSSGTVQTTKCTGMGPDWQCGDLENCLKLTSGFYDKARDTEDLLDLCDENPEICQTGMCTGKETNICCRNADPGGKKNPTKYICVARCVLEKPTFSFKEEKGTFVFDSAVWVNAAAVSALKGACSDGQCKIEVSMVEAVDEEQCLGFREGDFNCE